MCVSQQETGRKQPAGLGGGELYQWPACPCVSGGGCCHLGERGRLPWAIPFFRTPPSISLTRGAGLSTSAGGPQVPRPLALEPGEGDSREGGGSAKHLPVPAEGKVHLSPWLRRGWLEAAAFGVLQHHGQQLTGEGGFWCLPPPHTHTHRAASCLCALPTPGGGAVEVERRGACCRPPSGRKVILMEGGLLAHCCLPSLSPTWAPPIQPHKPQERRWRDG